MLQTCGARRGVFEPGYKVLKNLEDLLLKAARNEDYSSEIHFVFDFYKDDI